MNRPFRFRHIYTGLSTWLSNLSAWKKSCYIIVLNTRDLSYLNLHLLHRSIGPNTILRSAFRKSFADSIGWLHLLSCWQMVRQLHSIWLFGSSRIHCMLNSAIRLMSNAVFWNARKIAQNLPMHCFIPWIRKMNDFFRFFISGRISGHVIGYPENSYFCKANPTNSV